MQFTEWLLLWSVSGVAITTALTMLQLAMIDSIDRLFAKVNWPLEIVFGAVFGPLILIPWLFYFFYPSKY